MQSEQETLASEASVCETLSMFATWIIVEGQQDESLLDSPVRQEWHSEQVIGCERQELRSSEDHAWGYDIGIVC